MLTRLCTLLRMSWTYRFILKKKKNSFLIALLIDLTSNGMMILNELEMWKEVVVAYLRYYPSISPEKLRKAMKNVSQCTCSAG